MLEALFGTLPGKVAAAAIAVTVAVPALGAVGALPGPAQRPFDDATAFVGLGGHDDVTPAHDLPEPALEGNATADAKQDAALAYRDAMQVWTSCVARAAVAHEGATDPFDPVAECGARPLPHDVGLSDLPSQAAGNVPESVPAGPPSGIPSVPPSSAPGTEPAPMGPPWGTQGRWPSEVPPLLAGRP